MMKSLKIMLRKKIRSRMLTSHWDFETQSRHHSTRQTNPELCRPETESSSCRHTVLLRPKIRTPCHLPARRFLDLIYRTSQHSLRPGDHLLLTQSTGGHALQCELHGPGIHQPQLSGRLLRCPRIPSRHHKCQS